MREANAMQAILIGLGLCATVASCSTGNTEQQPPTPPTQTPPATPPPSTGQQMAFTHEETVGNPFGDGNQLSPVQAARLHVCSKVRYGALSSILASRGVNVATAMPDNAAQLYQTGNLVLGVANFGGRVGESDRNTTGGIARLFDILIAAADEIIANVPSRAECTVAGVKAQMFNADNTCNADGFACVLGMPLTQTQLQTCSDMVKDFVNTTPSDLAAGKRLAVATMAAPVFLCE